MGSPLPSPAVTQVARCYEKEKEKHVFKIIIKREHFLGRQNPLAESISVSMVNQFRQL